MKDFETETNVSNEAEKNRSDNVRVTAVYTATGKDKDFQAELKDKLNDVIEVAYKKLKEERRSGDKYFCSEEPRHDLAPHMSETLGEMYQKKVCVKKSRNKIEFEFDIDSDIGGAAI